MVPAFGSGWGESCHAVAGCCEGDAVPYVYAGLGEGDAVPGVRAGWGERELCRCMRIGKAALVVGPVHCRYAEPFEFYGDVFCDEHNV